MGIDSRKNKTFRSSARQDRSATPPRLPIELLEARLETLKAELREELAEIIRVQNELLLKQHASMKPLLSVDDLAKTLNVSLRTVETLIKSGQILPLWIKGQRRFHPDAVNAYLHACGRKKSWV